MAEQMDIGKVSPVPKGEYSSIASYERLDIVTYDGNTYIANKAVAGVSPSKETDENWTLLVVGNTADAVPTTRKVNGKALTGDIILIRSVSISIALTAWTGSGPFTYTLTGVNCTAAGTAPNLLLDDASLSALTSVLTVETLANQVKFTTETKPTAALTGMLILQEVVA